MGGGNQANFKAVEMLVESYASVSGDIQEKIREKGPELVNSFWQRSDLTDEHMRTLSKVLGKDEQSVKALINFLKEVAPYQASDFGNFYEPPQFEYYMGLAQKQGIAEMIRQLADYGYRFTISHSEVLGEMVSQRQRIFDAVVQIRKIFPDFKYMLEPLIRFNPVTQKREGRYISDPYEILFYRTPLAEVLETLYTLQEQQGSFPREFADGLLRSLRDRKYIASFQELDEATYQQFYVSLQILLEESFTPQGKIRDQVSFYLDVNVLRYIARNPNAINDILLLPTNIPRLFEVIRSNEGIYSNPSFMAENIFKNKDPLNFARTISRLLKPEFFQRFLMARVPVDIFAWEKQFADLGVENPMDLIEKLMTEIKNLDASRILATAEFFIKNDKEFNADIFISYVNDMGLNQALTLFEIYTAIMKDDFSNEALQAAGIKVKATGTADARAQQGIKQLKDIIKKFYRQLISSGEISDSILNSPLELDLLRFASNFDGSKWKREIDFKALVAGFLKAREAGRAGNLPELFYTTDDQGQRRLRTGTIRASRLGVEDFKFQADTVEFFERIMHEIEWSLKLLALEEQERVNRTRDSILPKIANEISSLNGKLDNVTGNEIALRQLESQITNLENLKAGIVNAKNTADLIIALGEFKPKNNTSLAVELRKLLFLQGLLVNDTVAEEFKDRLRSARQISFANINLFLEFTGNIIKEHVLGDNLQLNDGRLNLQAQMKKDLRRYLTFSAFQDEIKLMKAKKRTGSINLTVVPTRGVLGELSGYFCDACWTRQSNIMSDNPDTVFLAFIENYEDPSNARIVGGTLVIMTATNGQENFVIRGFNPQDQIADYYDMGELFTSFQKDYLDKLPGAEKRLFSVPHPDSGAFSNRPSLRQPVLSRLGGKVSLDLPNSFNGYNITNNVFHVGGELKASSSLDDKKSGAAKDNLGGIDLNPALYRLRIKRDDHGVPLPMLQQSVDVQDIKIDGLFPVIINIVPVKSLPGVLLSSNAK